jgi:hypothetical protein
MALALARSNPGSKHFTGVYCFSNLAVKYNLKHKLFIRCCTQKNDGSNPNLFLNSYMYVIPYSWMPKHFCWAKLNHRTLPSPPPKFGNDCQPCACSSACHYPLALFLSWLRAIYKCNLLTSAINKLLSTTGLMPTLVKLQNGLTFDWPTGFAAGKHFRTSRQMTDIVEVTSGPTSSEATYGWADFINPFRP